MEQLPPYDKLFKKYWKEIFYYCNKRLKDEDSAKDIAEESFIKTWQHYGKFVSEENAKAFVYVVAKNACINELERIKRHYTIKIEKSSIEDLFFESPSYDLRAIQSTIIAFIYAEIKKLPPRMRESIELLLHGENSTVAGNHLNITRKTVLNQKLKAIKILRNLVKLKFGI